MLMGLMGRIHILLLNVTIVATSTLYSTHMHAQRMSMHKFSEKDGLINNEIQSSFWTYDSIYYLTPAGSNIMKFDGYFFEEHPQQIPVVGWNYLQTSNYNVINTSFKGEPFVYRDNEFLQKQLCQNELIRIDNKSKLTHYVSRDTLWCIDDQLNKYYFDPEDQCHHLYEKINIKNIDLETFLKEKYRFFESIDGDLIIISEAGLDKTILKKSSGEILFYKKKFKGLLFWNRRVAYIEDNGDLFVWVNNEFRKVKGVIPKGTLHFHSFGKEDLGFLDNEVVSLYTLDTVNLNLTFVTKFDVNNKNRWDVINDQILMLSNHSGLRRLYKNIHYFDSGKDEIKPSLHAINEDAEGNIWFGSYGSGLCYWDGEGMHEPKPDWVGFEHRVFLPGGITRDEVTYYNIEAGFDHLVAIDGDKVSRYQTTGKGGNYAGFYIDTLRDGKLALGLVRNLSIETERGSHRFKEVNFEKGLKLKNVLTLAQDKNNRIWCSRPSDGIALYDMVRDTAHTYINVKGDDQSFGALAMEVDSLDNLWFGTGQGLYFLENPHGIELFQDSLFDRCRFVKLPNGEASMIIFMKQVDEFLVFGSKNAVSFLDLNTFYEDPDNPVIYQLIYGEDIQGRGSEQNAILFDSQRRLWLGHQDGASMINWDDFDFDHTINEVEIRYVISGTDTINFKENETFVIPSDNRNCSIAFGPKRNVSMLKNIFFDYYLVNNRGDTIAETRYDQKGVFSSNYLPPGSYQLKIDASKHGQLMDSMEVSFNVPRTLEESTWFWVLICLIPIGLVFYYFWNQSRIAKVDAKNELALQTLRNKQDNLQVQAIISSFNPHFINNSLHWIQSRYVEDDTFVKVVGRLSENIGYIFKNTRSGNAVHSLEGELQLVQNYIDIQLVRFRDSFKYIPPSEESIKSAKHLELLILQLQIHVENALEHGLRNRDNSSFIKVVITNDSEWTHIAVEDDGCGREQAESLNSKGTQQGTLMLNNLIDIFNSRNEKKIDCYYEDGIFRELDGTSFGTRFILKVPNDYRYIL